MTLSSDMVEAHLLLVEDDPAIAKSIVFVLERDGLSVTHCLTLRDARSQFTQRPPDLLILDIGLPDGSGLDWCKALRQSSAVAMLILSAQGEEIDHVLGLEFGADDYMSKPFSPRELLARVRSLLRRMRMQAATPASAQPASAKAANPFVINLEGQRASFYGKTLNLTRREFGLLAELLRAPGRIRPREALLAAVWGMESDSADRTVDTHIKTLRAKLQAIAPGDNSITTHRGMGYSVEF
jgi:two-component system, OmpR family, catabolic regulation response regulator CreB